MLEDASNAHKEPLTSRQTASCLTSHTPTADSSCTLIKSSPGLQLHSDRHTSSLVKSAGLVKVGCPTAWALLSFAKVELCAESSGMRQLLNRMPTLVWKRHLCWDNSPSVSKAPKQDSKSSRASELKTVQSFQFVFVKTFPSSHIW